jgi:hypothetical protein
MNRWRVGEDIGSKETDRCPLTLIPSLADDLHHPHPQLSLTARKSVRLKLYWIAECVTTAWSTWSNGRAIMRVTINGRCIHKYMQSQR